MSLARNVFVQSSLTLGSRILGFMRDVVMAAKVGAEEVGDAFVTALMFPNLFRRIFAEGAFAQAFIPIYARTLEAEGEEAARQVAQETMRGLFAVTAGLVIAAQLAMPWIMRVIHGGYAVDSDGFKLAVLLTQITMPYLACMAIGALLSGILNSAQRFILSAGVPILLNICMIAATWFGTPVGERPSFFSFAEIGVWLEAPPNQAAIARAVSIGVVIAGVLQAMILYWGVRRQKIRLSLGIPRLTPTVKKVALLAIPGVIAASGVQINILVSQALASWEEGAKSWLFYADRLYQLPLGLVGVAVGVAILPRLARSARQDDETGSSALMDNGIGLAMALTLPAAAALMIAPAYLLEGLYTRGAFLTSDAQQAGRALVHYGWGVPAFVLIKVLAPAYFAREDTKTPMRFSLISVVVNTALGASLFFWLKSQGHAGFPGLAIATSTAAWGNALMLFAGLRSRGWYSPGPILRSRTVRVLLATIAMSAVLIAIMSNKQGFEAIMLDSKLISTAMFILSGVATYAVAAVLLGAVKLSDLKRAG